MYWIITFAILAKLLGSNAVPVKNGQSENAADGWKSAERIRNDYWGADAAIVKNKPSMPKLRDTGILKEPSSAIFYESEQPTAISKNSNGYHSGGNNVLSQHPPKASQTVPHGTYDELLNLAAEYHRLEEQEMKAQEMSQRPVSAPSSASFYEPKPPTPISRNSNGYHSGGNNVLSQESPKASQTPYDELAHYEAEFYRLEKEEREAQEMSARPASAPSSASFNPETYTNTNSRYGDAHASNIQRLPVNPNTPLTSDVTHSTAQNPPTLQRSWGSFPSSRDEIAEPYPGYNEQSSGGSNIVPAQRKRKVSFLPEPESAPSANFQSSPDAANRPDLNQQYGRRPSFSSQMGHTDIDASMVNLPATGSSSSVGTPRPNSRNGPLSRTNAVSKRRPSQNPPSTGTTFDQICDHMRADGVGSCDGSNTNSMPNVAVPSQPSATIKRKVPSVRPKTPDYSVQKAFGTMFDHMLRNKNADE